MFMCCMCVPTVVLLCHTLVGACSSKAKNKIMLLLLWSVISTGAVMSIFGFLTWASYQIRKIAGCACTGNAENVFPPPRVSDPDMHHGTYVTCPCKCAGRNLVIMMTSWHRNALSEGNLLITGGFPQEAPVTRGALMLFLLLIWTSSRTKRFETTKNRSSDVNLHNVFLNSWPSYNPQLVWNSHIQTGFTSRIKKKHKLFNFLDMFLFINVYFTPRDKQCCIWDQFERCGTFTT